MILRLSVRFFTVAVRCRSNRHASACGQVRLLHPGRPPVTTLPVDLSVTRITRIALVLGAVGLSPPGSWPAPVKPWAFWSVRRYR